LLKKLKSVKIKFFERNNIMQTEISINHLRENISHILNEVNQNHMPITINNNGTNDSVILAKSDWSAICETLYLNSIPNMSKSIQQGLNADIDDCSDSISW
jgi:antitoxin YefM